MASLLERRPGAEGELAARAADPAGFYSTRAERAADVCARVGGISEQDRLGWLDALRAARAAGRFLAGIPLLFVWGTRPSTPASDLETREGVT